MKRLSLFALVGCVATMLSACDTPQEPDPAINIEPIQIDSVDVSILESAPAQARAHIKGLIGDGCSELIPIEQSRSSNVVTVSIRRERTLAEACAQIAKLFDDVVPLEGTFAPGDYQLHVNDVSVAFRVD